MQGLKLSGNDIPFVQNSQNWGIHSEIPKIPKKFPNRRIFGISWFCCQNRSQGLKLSGKNILFVQNGQNWGIHRVIPGIPKNSRILGISQFRLQNPVQWPKLSGKNAPYCNFGWKCPNQRENRKSADKNQLKSADLLKSPKLPQRLLIMKI